LFGRLLQSTGRIEAKDVENMPSYKASCTIALTPVQVFDLAADVQSYPEFLPGYVATRINRRDGDVYYCDQIVGFGAFRKCFASKTELLRPGRIDVTSSDRMFRRFNLVWHFDPVPDGGCRVTLELELELRSRLAQDMFSQSINHTTEAAIQAFKARAEKLFGHPEGASCGCLE
jgi:coenzyme Q-binding protein COQ10